MKHVSSTTYYLQGNGQVKSTNKVFGTLFTKLVNENIIDKDVHLFVVLFLYKIADQVALVEISQNVTTPFTTTCDL